ncbi:hypothetical protein [Pseudomonas nunensis]|uniref:Uncharacterized protein n=1 Tax=Pseudomonas nunensis TaxID=2961896 RepID=A0ABY5EKN9_9PSED|nr:hypothetical protein [Pseudomonas nunensis]KPN93462.1 hypothetical protein AL066_00995 [Pseudomonas nunensis]MCL5228135.1 hypothetical protein [Pseudomonas nunensis]UTO14983.1 hypothetical protein NK667_01045 [Pseudomonas nunensis]
MMMQLAHRAFPSCLEQESKALDQVLGQLSQAREAMHRFIEVRVGGEELVIPYRIYDQGYEVVFDHLTETQSILYSCLLTRHHDGHMRQRHLERILSVREPWVVPFVVQLMGEYVIQILETVEAHLPTLDPALYGRFIRDNQVYFQTTHARMISYWDCYYRRLYKYPSEYVGFRVFAKLCEFP